MYKRQVEENEESMFRKYIKDIKREHPGTELSYFEMNLEVLTHTQLLPNLKLFLKLFFIFVPLDLETIMASLGSVEHRCHHYRCKISSK